MHVHNVTRNCPIGDRIDVADTSAKRRTGLLQHPGLEPGQGLWIVPCEAIHMIGMKFPIDVIFLSKKKQVLKVRSAVKPGWHFSACLTAHSVLELPVGTIEGTGTEKGDQLQLVR